MNTPPKILIIDDSHDALDMLEILLYKEYDILTSLNGFDGLKKAEEDSPDLIITDIMMPVMDGIRFFNNLKKQSKTAQIPVIAVTSFLKKITRRSLQNIGFDAVISKPFERKTIIEAINKIFQTNPVSADNSTDGPQT